MNGCVCVVTERCCVPAKTSGLQKMQKKQAGWLDDGSCVLIWGEDDLNLPDILTKRQNVPKDQPFAASLTDTNT